MPQSQTKFQFIDSSNNEIEAVRHINPDGSLGGWVGNDFRGNNVTIGIHVVVYPGVAISDGAIISGNCVIMPYEVQDIKRSA